MNDDKLKILDDLISKYNISDNNLIRNTKYILSRIKLTPEIDYISDNVIILHYEFSNNNSSIELEVSPDKVTLVEVVRDDLCGLLSEDLPMVSYEDSSNSVNRILNFTIKYL